MAGHHLLGTSRDYDNYLIFFNALGILYYAELHAAGRYDLTAKIHMAVLPLYLVLLFSLIQGGGVFGAAWAWVARVIVDTGLLIAVSAKR